MHQAAYDFIAQQVERLQDQYIHLPTCLVIEVGSHDVNGSVRPLLAGALQYTGIDYRAGPGVDVVGRVQDIAPTLGCAAQIVISCEALEHDTDQYGHVLSCYTLLQAGGWMLLTAAAPEREPHSWNGGPLPAKEDYKPVDPGDLYRFLVDLGAKKIGVFHKPELGDVYAVAQKGADHATPVIPRRLPRGA